MSKLRGFTLVELLIVVVIVAVLAAILIPASMQARESGRKSACVSNIAQSWKSIRLYVDDYDGCWPSLPAWQDWSQTHQGLPLCPSVAARRSGAGSRGVPGYAYNTALTRRMDAEGKSVGAMRDADIAFPAVTIALCEEAPKVIRSWGPDPFFNVAPYPYGQEEGWKRHNGGANYAFCDGHVKWYAPSEVGYNQYPPGNDGTKPTFAVFSKFPPL